jgi:replicative DNA helicase
MAEIPKNADAEGRVIASLAMDPALWPYALDLDGACFAQVDYRMAFEQMADRVSKGRTWMPDDWGESILAAGPFVGWSYELGELVKRLLSARVCRAGMEVARRVAIAAQSLDASGVETALVEAKLPGRGVAPESLADIAERAVAMITDDKASVIRCDVSVFDGTAVLRRMEECVLAARPSVGKSQMAFDIARNVASWGQHVLVASFEMAAPHVLGRMAGPKVGFGFRQADTPERAAKMATEIRRIGELENLTVTDRLMTSMELFSEARRLADKSGSLDLLVVDHVRLLTDRDPEERHRLGAITRNLRQLAKELNCAVLVCTQLNRGVESRDNKRPTLADLRDSGEIEENTDSIVFIYRKNYHSDNPDERLAAGTAELWIAKNRNGALGGGELWFDPARGPLFTSTAMVPPPSWQTRMQE